MNQKIVKMAYPLHRYFSLILTFTMAKQDKFIEYLFVLAD